MEHQPVCKDDRQRCRKGQVAERHVRVAGFDGHGDKIQAAGAGVLHINQRIPHAADHTPQMVASMRSPWYTGSAAST